MEKIDKRLLEPEGKSHEKTLEQIEWEKAGCSNNEEWHLHLNTLMWRPYTPIEEDDGIYR